jgi:hypothetical protein
MKKILPYIIVSIIVIAFWKIWTSTDNYAWSPEGKELLMLDIALTSIFIYKTLFWLIIGNTLVYSFKQFKKNNYKTLLISLSLITVFYFSAGYLVERKCAYDYYIVFINQSVAEEFNDRPIIEAGYEIGKVINENILDKEMKLRRYAIGGLEKIKYLPATNNLSSILNDRDEMEEFRADAYETLTKFNTRESKSIITSFNQKAKDTIDRNVIKLGEYFLKSSE